MDNYIKYIDSVRIFSYITLNNLKNLDIITFKEGDIIIDINSLIFLSIKSNKSDLKIKKEIFYYLCKNKNIPIELLINHECYYFNFCENTYELLTDRCSFSDILKYNNLINSHIFFNDNIPIDFKLKNLHLRNGLYYSEYFLNNTKLTFEEILKYNLENIDKYIYYFNYPIKYFLIYPNNKYFNTINPTLSELKLLILNFPDKIDWNNISDSKNITFDDIKSTIDDKNYKWVISNVRNITIDFYKKYNCHIYDLCRSKNITIDDILMNPDIPWNFNILSYNPNITFKIIEKYPEFPWNIKNLFLNEMTEPFKYKMLKQLILNEIYKFPVSNNF